jgi:hypothetical protein
MPAANGLGLPRDMEGSRAQLSDATLRRPKMSFEAIASSAGLPLNLTDIDTFDFESQGGLLNALNSAAPPTIQQPAIRLKRCRRPMQARSMPTASAGSMS